MRLIFAHVDENYLRALRALFKYTPINSSRVVPVVMPVRPHALYASLQKTHPAPVALMLAAVTTGHQAPDANVMACGPHIPDMQSTLTRLVHEGKHDVVVIQPPADARALYVAVVNAITATPPTK